MKTLFIVSLALATSLQSALAISPIPSLFAKEARPPKPQKTQCPDFTGVWKGNCTGKGASFPELMTFVQTKCESLNVTEDGSGAVTFPFNGGGSTPSGDADVTHFYQAEWSPDGAHALLTVAQAVQGRLWGGVLRLSKLDSGEQGQDSESLLVLEEYDLTTRERGMQCALRKI